MPFGSHHLQGIQHILGLARLADKEAHILVVDRRDILGDELRGQHRDRRPAGQLGKVNRACQAGVVTGAAADEVQLARGAHLFEHDIHISDCPKACAAVRAPPGFVRGSPSA